MAELYDRMYPWNPEHPYEGFFHALVLAADAVLDVGCGTGMMLHTARASGHTGRLVGLDPDLAALARARRLAGIEWVPGVAADAAWDREFDLATMTSNAFQCLIDDDEVRASLAAIRAALRDGGRFAFDTRNPVVREWERWTQDNATDVVDRAGRKLRQFHHVESVVDGVVTMTETVTAPDGTVLRVDRGRLRFLDESALDTLLTEAGFTIEGRYGDWERGPVTADSRSLLTIARR